MSDDIKAGVQFQEVFTDYEGFIIDFHNEHTDPQMTDKVSCPKCKRPVLLNRWRGFGEGPYGWCRTCGIAVGR